MENYSYPASYPDSGDSSPRSREIEFDNPPPWEDPQNPQSSLNYKVKFMCSYGGKIQPRPHDNQLSYMGGETKILAVDRTIKFSSLVSKLSALCESDGVAFKYQLPGEDLDALISVTNDDDLEHMMHEYDRLFRGTPKPARLRLFLFPVNPNPLPPPTVVRNFGSDETIKSEKERFVEALNSGPIQASLPPSMVAPPPPQAGNVDFLFGLEKGGVQPPMQQQPPAPAAPPVAAVKLRDPIADQTLHEHEVPAPALDDRMIGADAIHKHIQDLQRLRIEEHQQQGMYRRTSDESLPGGYSVGGGGEYYVQRAPDKISPVNGVPGTMPPQPAGYWPEKQVPGGVFPASSYGTDQPVYMIPAPAGAYHGQMIRQMTGPAGQGYYTIQRMPEFYREQQQPQYNGTPQMGTPVQSVAAAPPSLPHQPQAKIPAGYSENYGMVRPTSAGAVGVTETGYPQMAYDGAGRQVYYTAGQGGMSVMGGPPQAQAPPQQQQQQQVQYQQTMAAAAGAADVKALTQEAGKVVPKATQNSV
ncbi:OLC1v1002780C1 [Oldenlandia corymbosa var. corymbosa]|uniref:OLC1v1002780C1 n=1 Tax=Oldenlandia corymbosa var. corymbosa TaxID=529605 RepID=A0AAV1D8G9_OLDCO|nr:OLC1v1002780C1 [Oldenlandia corymbosa var. corymbosa]